MWTESLQAESPASPLRPRQLGLNLRICIGVGGTCATVGVIPNHPPAAMVAGPSVTRLQGTSGELPGGGALEEKDKHSLWQG